MTIKNIKKTKLSHLKKGLIGNYHYGLNIEHAKPVHEKGMIVNTLLVNIQIPLSKQWEGKGVLQASYICIESNINNN